MSNIWLFWDELWDEVEVDELRWKAGHLKFFFLSTFQQLQADASSMERSDVLFVQKLFGVISVQSVQIILRHGHNN